MSEATATAVPNTHPIRLRITDDLQRTRLTVFFRLFLAIPHLVWEALLAIVAILAVLGNWIATLISGRSPDGLHSFLAAYLRYATHVSAYMFLLADPYPGFLFINLKEDYPIDVEIDGPVEQDRLGVGFRIILAIPAMASTGSWARSTAPATASSSCRCATRRWPPSWPAATPSSRARSGSAWRRPARARSTS